LGEIRQNHVSRKLSTVCSTAPLAVLVPRAVEQLAVPSIRASASAEGHVEFQQTTSFR